MIEDRALAPRVHIPSGIGRAIAAEPYQTQIDPGDSSGEATPVPIPNTEVKLSSAEDTERAAFRENRSSPGSFAFPGVNTGVHLTAGSDGSWSILRG